MKLLLFFLSISTSVLSYNTFDSVSVFQENGENKVYFKLKGIYLGSTIRRVESEFVASDTLTKIDVYTKFCEGALANNYWDTVVVLDQAIYPPEFNLRINVFYDTNTVFSTPPENCPIYHSPWLAFWYPLSIDEIASTTEAQLEKDFLIYPNPASGFITIQTDAHILNEEYIITDPLGKMVRKGKYKPKIDISELSKGQYFFILRTEKYIYRRKFMVE
ncbi:T9SS type A sorting domain-containing protein [Brumimicrobium aurantiacum]|uniref:T9SS C-terminal target domain-containing protein n=1 Tax=Brumimicrobium aurantiacum TaxID=1737063 RepID=A0A3E1EXD2_9FLAO|nr:T9SS type A sorting domain-containing protein [Brumimicrobium aurantiacum]RFC54224.1 T9SS C-terminal target domain-containing protein [Brumimicrobium aurantiacum]